MSPINTCWDYHFSMFLPKQTMRLYKEKFCSDSKCSTAHSWGKNKYFTNNPKTNFGSTSSLLVIIAIGLFFPVSKMYGRNKAIWDFAQQQSNRHSTMENNVCLLPDHLRFAICSYHLWCEYVSSMIYWSLTVKYG